MATAWRKRWPPPRTWYGGKGVPVRWCQAGAAASKRGRSSFTIGAPKNSAQCCRSWWYRPVIGALKMDWCLKHPKELSSASICITYINISVYVTWKATVCLGNVWLPYGGWLVIWSLWHLSDSFSFDWRSGHNKRKQTAESFTQMSQSEGASFNSDKKP